MLCALLVPGVFCSADKSSNKIGNMVEFFTLDDGEIVVLSLSAAVLDETVRESNDNRFALVDLTVEEDSVLVSGT